VGECCERVIPDCLNAISNLCREQSLTKARSGAAENNSEADIRIVITSGGSLKAKRVGKG